MTRTVDAVASVEVLVERLATQFAVNSERVVTTVGTVTTVTSSLEQFLIKVTFIRLAAAVTRYTRTPYTAVHRRPSILPCP